MVIQPLSTRLIKPNVSLSHRRSPTVSLESRIQTFSVYVPGARFSKVPRTFRARKAIRKTATCLFCKAGLLICCKGNRNKNNCKVSCLETPSFWRYKENYVTRNTPEKFRDFRETGPWSFWCECTMLKRDSEFHH